MSNFQVEKRKQHWLYALLIILIVLNIFLIRGVWRVYQKSQLAGNNYLSAQDRLDKLNERKKVLTDKLADLKTERGLEEQIRTNFSVVKPGERVVVIVDTPTSTASSSSKRNSLWWAIKAVFLSN